MAYTPIQPTPTQVKVELDSNGALYGTARTNQEWNVLEGLMNDKTAVPSINRRIVDIHELCEAIDAGGLAALTVAQRECILFITTCAVGHSIDPENTVTRSYFTTFSTGGATGATRTRLIALQTRVGSRAESRWGDGVFVGADVIEAAARLA